MKNNKQICLVPFCYLPPKFLLYFQNKEERIFLQSLSKKLSISWAKSAQRKYKKYLANLGIYPLSYSYRKMENGNLLILTYTEKTEIISSIDESVTRETVYLTLIYRIYTTLKEFHDYQMVFETPYFVPRKDRNIYQQFRAAVQRLENKIAPLLYSLK